jgi:hypothetical protein
MGSTKNLIINRARGHNSFINPAEFPAVSKTEFWNRLKENP